MRHFALMLAVLLCSRAFGGDLLSQQFISVSDLRLKPSKKDKERFRLALKAVEAGENAKAEAQFADLLDRQPAWAAAHSNRGVALFRMYRWQEGCEEMQAAYQSDPSGVITRKNYAVALLASNQSPEALQVLKETERLAPGDGDVTRLSELARHPERLQLPGIPLCTLQLESAER